MTSLPGGGKNTGRLEVLCDQRVIPNYRVPIFSKLASFADIRLTVSYWSARDAEEPAHVSTTAGFQTVAFSPLRYSVLGRRVALNLDLVRYVCRVRPDVVMGPFGMFGFNTLLSWSVERVLQKRFGTSFMYRVSRPLPEGKTLLCQRARRRWQHRFLRDAVITTYGERAAQALLRQGARGEHLFVDYNSMDTESLLRIRETLGLRQSEWKEPLLLRFGIRSPGFVLFVGRLLPDKRLDVLIDSWQSVLKSCPNAQLVVVGSGPAKDAALQQAHGLHDSIIFIDGIYDETELSKLYMLSSIVAFPGYATLSVHFAMCMGKPIVCSEFGNEVEYITNGANGLLYELGNAEQLAVCILSLLCDEPLRARFGRASDRLVAEKVNSARMVETIHTAILTAARRRPATLCAI